MKTRLPFARIIADEHAAAAIEFGIVGAFLSFLFLGVVDFGAAYWEKMQVGNAARAGAEYAIVNGYNQTDITTAVTNATGLSSITASPAPTQSCGCPDASTPSNGITAATCGSTCTGGIAAGTYVTVGATASYSTFFNYPGIGSPISLTASVTVRIN